MGGGLGGEGKGQEEREGKGRERRSGEKWRKKER